MVAFLLFFTSSLNLVSRISYGIKDSWTEYNVTLPIWVKGNFAAPVACVIGSSQQILFQVGKKFLVQYDLEKMSIEFAHFVDDLDYCLVACICFGSLIQPCGGNDGYKGNNGQKQKVSKMMLKMTTLTPFVN